mmetsp:Transcript_34533/g.70590  ORF Transcript_34533/g.70590 Transcript_34533/m.70590 type:complete len:238 (+) Transcript_34533:983-1696(+)
MRTVGLSELNLSRFVQRTHAQPVTDIGRRLIEWLHVSRLVEVEELEPRARVRHHDFVDDAVHKQDGIQRCHSLLVCGILLWPFVVEVCQKDVVFKVCGVVVRILPVGSKRDGFLHQLGLPAAVDNITHEFVKERDVEVRDTVLAVVGSRPSDEVVHRRVVVSFDISTGEEASLRVRNHVESLGHGWVGANSLSKHIDLLVHVHQQAVLFAVANLDVEDMDPRVVSLNPLRRMAHRLC